MGKTLNNSCAVLFMACLLALSLPAHAGGPGAPAVSVPSNDMQGNGPVIHLSPPDEYTGGLDVRIHPDYGGMEPSADFLLTDPQGRRTGNDPRTGLHFEEIPRSFYDYEGLDDDETGEPGPSSGVTDIGNPLPGEYRLQVIGKEDGKYDIEFSGYPKEGEASGGQVLGVPIKKGEVHEYVLVYSNKPGGKTTVQRKRE